MLSAAMLRLLPMQVLMLAVASLNSYQASGREKFANFLAVLDGVADVVIVSLVLMPVIGMAKDVQYQNILGLNILTIRI